MDKHSNAAAWKECLCLALCVGLSVVLLSPGTTAADENGQGSPEPAPATRRMTSPYCGVYCLYTAMKLADREVDFRQLLEPEYIGSRKGSSLAELKKAAEDHGMHAQPIGNLTSDDLRCSRHPLILHVKTSIEKVQYDHYMLFIGTENGQAVVFDPPSPIRAVPFQELVGRWNGVGLAVSTDPINVAGLFARTYGQFIMSVIVVIAAILVIRLLGSRWLPLVKVKLRRRSFGVAVAEGTGFAVVALLCGVIYHSANEEGLLANAKATASIQQAHKGNFIPKVSEKKVRKLLGRDTVFLDARYDRDFKAGHLEGAISVPVDANDVQRREATAGIAKDAHVVLYCQSSRCKFAEIVAIKLLSDGFSNICIFRGGWNEWKARNGNSSENMVRMHDAKQQNET